MKWLGFAVLSVAYILAISPPTPEASDASDAAHVKAAWITRWGFKTREDVEGLLEELNGLGVGTVFFQVRGAADALYLSELEPWSDVLTGRLGVDPGWDPLATAVEHGHRLGIEVHAWINVFPAWPVSDAGEPAPKSIPLHVSRVQPVWLAQDKGGGTMPLKRSEAKHNYAFLSPTHPGVQEHVLRVVEDLVGRYEVDGLHLDYVRFPDSTYSYDARSRSSYLHALQDTQITFADWRRDNLTEFVGAMAYTARLARPGVRVSAAVWQRIDSGRNYYLQDGIEWQRRGYTDFLVPMIYTTSVEAFEERLRAYTESAGANNVVAGMGPYLEAFNDSIFAAQLDLIKSYGARGVAIFNSDYALAYSPLVRSFDPAEAGR
jgi:uncharacterized lipoprotein YddW (UPF0748 family)